MLQKFALVGSNIVLLLLCETDGFTVAAYGDVIGDGTGCRLVGDGQRHWRDTHTTQQRSRRELPVSPATLPTFFC